MITSILITTFLIVYCMSVIGILIILFEFPIDMIDQTNLNKTLFIILFPIYNTIILYQLLTKEY